MGVRDKSPKLQVLYLVLPVIAVVGILDQYTKHLIEGLLEPHEILPVIDGYFNLTLNFNKGAAFGIFAGLPDGVREVVLWTVSGVAVSAVIYFLFTEYLHNRVGQFGLGLILGGAIGNGIDRFSRGEVVDFLDFYFGSYHWPAFNVADTAISIGAGLLILAAVVSDRKRSLSQ
ncbi:MAG: signal peptidase II [Bdellovibrionales bacterium]|nr:signal peptidase II [Bdellovibrionales bacterium]